MTTLTLRRIKDHFVITGPDIEPMKFTSRREAKDWCGWNHPRVPVIEIGRDASEREVRGSKGRPRKGAKRDGQSGRTAIPPDIRLHYSSGPAIRGTRSRVARDNALASVRGATYSLAAAIERGKTVGPAAVSATDKAGHDGWV